MSSDGYQLRRVCVFCGSSFGARASYREAARVVADLLVDQGIDLVYGGSSVGLMTVVADTVLARGGRVEGIITRHLADHEIAHEGLSRLHVVDSMAERTGLMAELSDGFLVLPGGLGTLDELFEMVVRAQLGLQHKPVGLLDVDGYFAHLQAFLHHAVDERLVKSENLELLVFDTDPERLLDRMRAFDPPQVEKWLDLPDG